MKLDNSSEIHLFSVPIFQYKLNDENKKVKEFCLSEKENDLNNINYKIGASNTGWHSRQWSKDNLPKLLSNLELNFLEILKKSISSLIKNINLNFEIFEIESDFVLWSIVNENGDYNFRHTHTSKFRETWAIVYYLDIPEDMEGGEIRFFNPCSVSRNTLGATLSKITKNMIYHKVKPMKNDVVVFPGWLEHDVLPYSSINCNSRIIIAANYSISSLKIKDKVSNKIIGLV